MAIPSLANLPVLRPPPGVTSNFDNPESNATTLLAVNWIFTPLAALMVCIRIVTRASFEREHGYGWDDTLILLAQLGSIAHAVLVTIALPLGYGRHFWDVRAISLTAPRLHIFTSFEQTYFVTLLFIKLSIFLLYKRLFGIYKGSRKLIYTGLGLVTVTTIPAFGIAVARSVKCDGLQAINTAICHAENVNIAVTTFSVCNTITDFYTLIIPINRILKLHVGNKKKMGLLVIFLAGLTACIMSVARLAMIITNFNSADQLWDGSKITPFTIIEMNLGIICSCLMFVPAFTKQAQITTNSLVGSGSDSFQSRLRLRRSRSQILSTENDSKRDIELTTNSSHPELPPFLGNTSSSYTTPR